MQSDGMNALKDNFHIERDSPRPRAKANFTFKLTPYENSTRIRTPSRSNSYGG